ncbi:hypothetical protein [Alteribacter populi]|uniref:hypothetical protein n=1 Tax=Alteribacter populi TaxID=2011011 RepID=UPI000BBAD0E4|nr:hypothetical protein [Alteribacter populi]
MAVKGVDILILVEDAGELKAIGGQRLTKVTIRLRAVIRGLNTALASGLLVVMAFMYVMMMATMR